MELQAFYNSDDLIIEFRAEGIWTDYGVPNSDVLDIENVEILTVTIAGASFDPWKLPTELTDHLLDLADEVEFEQV
jgi:hypothetical protein